MDAQNAVESANTKHAASPKWGVAESDDSKSTVTASSATTNNNIKLPPIAKPSSTNKDSRPATTPTNAQDDDAGPDQNSDAETIVLPGKDGISPSKPRKVIKHEDKSDGEIDDILPSPRKHLRDDKNGDRNGGPSDDVASSLGKKRRPLEKERQPRNKDISSGLSSAPASPPPHHRNHQDQAHRRRTFGDVNSESDSESAKSKSSKDPIKNKSKSVDRLLPGKRKAPKAESDNEAESRKVRRPRISDVGLDNPTGVKEKDQKSSSRLNHDKHPSSQNRSVSPHGRIHRRSLSTQLPQSSNGPSTKKKRVPPPLHPTDYHSDESSASGSPHPRSSKLRSIATPVTGESTVSPARMPPHKKHVDNHGQTLLAKACAKGEYEVAKKRLTERPEDLNFADYAGNTPLQVASLNGHEQIVQLLIDAGCNLDCRNSDKETPLLDAVENGHLGVVKLLLKAGVNPRKADAEGHEPLEKVPDDLENAEEIRAALREAKERVGELRRTSEDHQPHDLPDTLSSHGPESPRRSPAASASGTLAAQRRGGAVRSTKTSNHLLYMNLDDKTLRQAAARGDNETVTRVLQVKERCDDPEALVNAARGGHSFVVELLLALGGANPDPRPVSSLPTEYGTPMLAAIGGENIEVIKLLLNASGFDPTRRYKGQTYYELARRREGPMWKEEEHILKNAYDEFKKTSKASSKTKSPGRRDRDREIDQESRRANRNESNSEFSRSHKRRPSSPSRDADSKKKAGPSKVSSSPKEKRLSHSLSNHDEQTSPKRGPGRPKKEERAPNVATSDREVSPVRSRSQPTKSKLADTDPAGGSSDNETTKPRRKLISGRDLKGHREKQRRASMASNNSTVNHSDARNDDVAEKRPDRLSEKYHDRTKAIKRDESNDRLSIGEASGKRQRSSVTPPRHGSGDKEDAEAPVKRRRLDADGKERRQLPNSSPDDRQQKRDLSRDPAKRQRPLEADRKETSKVKKTNRERKEADKASPLEKASIVVASEDPDVEMRDAPQTHPVEDSEAQAERERKEAKRRQAELEAIAAEEAKKEAERQHQEAERRRQEAEAKRQEEAEKKRLQEEERLRLEREEKKRKEEEEKARLEEEQRQREEEERRLREEEEKKRREEERRRQEEEARIRREKEAAEEARRLQEEEERKERERKRAERAAREAEMQRARQEELERIRLSKLPPLLRWLDGCPDPKQREIAELFAKAQGVRYDTINPTATGRTGGRDQWLLNTQVALLLGEKDVSLSRYTAWERIPVSNIAKRVIWRLEQERYALTEGRLYHLGEQLHNYYGGDPRTVGYKRLEELRGEAAKCFLETDMFFVKESDFLYIVPTVPHLRGIKLSICYCELPEHESALTTWSAPAKWKQDPDAESRGSFAPRYKYYINGQLVGEDKPRQYQPSKTPFPEHRVPRRGGLIAVTPDEPDYARLCVEQGLTHLLTDQQKQAVLNGAHLTPRSMASNEPPDYSGENLSPSTESLNTAQVNGIKSAQGSPDRLPVNGINGDEFGGH